MKRRASIDIDHSQATRRGFIREVFSALQFEEEYRMRTRDQKVRVFGTSPRFEEHTPGDPTPRFRLTNQGTLIPMNSDTRVQLVSMGLD